MMSQAHMTEYRQIQQIARQTIEDLKREICPGMRLAQVREMCEQRMLALGADSFWYHGIGAFVFCGDETAVSVSGRQYVTSDRLIAEDDIVTVDLSPQKNGAWGDYARTVVLEGGAVRQSWQEIRREAWRAGLAMQERLHGELLRFATPQTTFHQLHAHINALIEREGFVNLDFHGNLGHSICRQMDDRVYTEAGNHAPLSSCALFTFEPHIGLPGSAYGYKKENIYFFEGERLKAL